MSRIGHFLVHIKSRTWLVVVAVVAALERLCLYFSYHPVSYNDTLAYRRLAGQVMQGWPAYDGTRLPGYPIFLAWLGPDERVYAAQLILGFLITLLFFYLGWRLTGRGWFAALAAAAYTLNPQTLLVEADLLTETLTIFLFALCLAGTAWLLYSASEPASWKAILAGMGIGLAAGLTIMVRPLFIFLPFLAALALLLPWRARWRIRWAAALPVLAVSLALVGTWVNYIHARSGTWGLDVMGGYHLMNHVGPFFQDAPDEYAAVRDAFLRYQAAQLAKTGSTGNAIWDAIPELEQVSHLGFDDLSRLLSRIAFRLILQHPGLYLKNVALGWLNFWRVPVHWTPALPGRPVLGFLQRGIILILRGCLFLCNLVFIAGTLALVSKRFRLRLRMKPFLWLSLGSIWAASLLQTLVEYGDNPRYSIPLQTLILLVVIYWGVSLLSRTEHENSLA
ncbi:MAG TPA: hypothetical protein VMC09_18935 [Anaerolineales bacterium]|nr:hypothetical protein [Anaerolineales bacterium]